MAWFEDKFNSRYRGLKRPYEDLPYQRKKVYSFSLTLKIIFINVAVFFILLLYLLFTKNEELILNNLALRPSFILNGRNLWTLITHMFVHLDPFHLLMNMISLSFIGSFVEKLIGKKRFFWLYLIGGFIAGLFFVFLAGFFGSNTIGERLFGNPFIFAVGASGAIFALAGLLTVLTPRIKVLVFFIIPMPLWIGILFLLFFFWILSLIGGLPIGNSAHLGGFLCGLIYGFYLRRKYPNKVRILQRIFS